jgi:hypothetical protein
MKRHSTNIHERFLRHIWSQQYLKQSALCAADGKPVNVLAVGTLNEDGGPDFRNAKIKIDGTTFAGDVEIHRTVYEWLQHHHESDPRYNRVILHVVLEGNAEQSPTVVQCGRTVPVLVLEPFLSESIRSVWQKTILDERARRNESIKCYRVNDAVNADMLRRWLNHLSVERLELKLRRLEERLKQLAHENSFMVREHLRRYRSSREGSLNEIPPPIPDLTHADFAKKELWEQVLYEGVMEGLGYSKNREPFSRLAQTVSLAWIRNSDFAGDLFGMEAVLFGASGLLPKTLTLKEKESRVYCRELTRRWRKERVHYRGDVLHAADWQFFPTRPTNFPTVRLAAVPQLIGKFVSGDLFRKVIQTLKLSLAPIETQRALLALFSVEPHPFWSMHYTFDERTGKPINPLGRSRTDDIIINSILPISLLYARVFKDKTVRERVLQLNRSLPALSENSVTRLMAKQLLKGKIRLDSVGAQQGVIQLYKYYCVEERCEECEVGKLVFNNP